MRPHAFLRNGLDRDVDQIVRKLEADASLNDLPPLILDAASIYTAIQKSNSSLRRQKKKFLEDSIERVLAVRQQEVDDGRQRRRRNGDIDSEEEIEAETNRVYAEAVKEDERYLVNRQMIKLWHIDTAKPGAPEKAEREEKAEKTEKTGEMTEKTQREERADQTKPNKKRKLAEDAETARRSSSRNGTRTDNQPSVDDTSKPIKKPRNRPYGIESSSNAPALGGLDAILTEFRIVADGILNHPHFWTAEQLGNSHGVLVTGPSGSGKRSLVRAVAAHAGRPVVRIRHCFNDVEKLDRNLADALEEARSLAPCVMLLDRVHDYMPRPSGAASTGDLRNKCVDSFEGMMERLSAASVESVDAEGGARHILVVATTNKEADVDPRVLAHLKRVVAVPFPDAGAREDILRITMARGGQVADGFDYTEHAKNTHGYTGGDLRDVVHLAWDKVRTRLLCQMDRQRQSSDNGPLGNASQPPLLLTNEVMAGAIRSYIPHGRKEGFSLLPTTTLSQVGALAEARRQLQLSIIAPIRNPAAYERFGAGTSAGVLLWGPPGCGKTFVAQAVANEAQASFIVINGPELLNKYVGESERSVRELFVRARAAAPCVLFFDEMESLVPRREATTTDAGTRVVNTLLTELDGVNKRHGVYVIGTTNRPDMIDPAMLRPGRLDRKLFLDLPTEDERVEVLSAIVRSHLLGATEGDRAYLETVARDGRCANFSGADLKGLYFKAAEHALEQARTEEAPERWLTDEDWEYALARVRPSVNVADHKRYLALAKQFQG